MAAGGEHRANGEQGQPDETRPADYQRAVRQGDSTKRRFVSEPERDQAGEQDRENITRKKYGEPGGYTTRMPACGRRPPLSQLGATLKCWVRKKLQFGKP